jgi:hypothetical protein
MRRTSKMSNANSSAAAATKQEMKFRKCANEGCDIMISFQPKPNGKGWSAVGKDVVGQLHIHRCQGKRVQKPQQPQTSSTNTTTTGTSVTKAEILALLQNVIDKVKMANIP